MDQDMDQNQDQDQDQDKDLDPDQDQDKSFPWFSSSSLMELDKVKIWILLCKFWILMMHLLDPPE